MRLLLHAFAVVHAVMAALFAAAAMVLMIVAARLGWEAATGG